MKVHRKFEVLNHLLISCFVLLSLPLFFYKLGQTSLVSWDEAWYAQVAKNIINSGDVFNLEWNGNPFLDHPPTGYWLMAFAYKILGINEFTTRLPSALAGIFSVILLYLLGKKLFNPLVGLSSAVALTSAIWFIYRSRSGNLDVLLTMFFLLTIYLAILASENKRYLYYFIISLVLLFFTKTMVPITILPSLFIIFYKSKLYKWKDLLLPSLTFLIFILSWFLTKRIQHPYFFDVYFDIGLRGITLKTGYIANLKLAKEYLHNGIGRWFWPSIVSLLLSNIFRQKRFLIIFLLFISFLTPVIFSPKIQIWHLIPLFPFMILSFFGVVFTFLETYLHRWKFQIYFFVLILSSYIYFNQIRMIWYQVIDIPAFVSDEAILSREAKKYPLDLFIDGDFTPAASFYSDKKIIHKAPIGREELASFLTQDKSFLIITNKWRLEGIPSQNYQILKEDRDKVLIMHKL